MEEILPYQHSAIKNLSQHYSGPMAKFIVFVLFYKIKNFKNQAQVAA